MIVRNGDYVYADGTVFAIDGLQSIYVSRRKTGIAIQYLDGHLIEITYDGVENTMKAWNTILEGLKDLLEAESFASVADVMLVRMDTVRHIEYDGVDERFAMLYKSGECFIFDFHSVTVSRDFYWLIMERYFGVKRSNNVRRASQYRHRADFWSNVTATINGMLKGEKIPNKQYWIKVDAAVINASQFEKG